MSAVSLPSAPAWPQVFRGAAPTSAACGRAMGPKRAPPEDLPLSKRPRTPPAALQAHVERLTPPPPRWGLYARQRAYQQQTPWVSSLADDVLIAVLLWLGFPTGHGQVLRTSRRFNRLASTEAYWRALLQAAGVCGHALAAVFTAPSMLAAVTPKPTLRLVCLYHEVSAAHPRCCVCFTKPEAPATCVFTQPFRVAFCQPCAEVFLVRRSHMRKELRPAATFGLQEAKSAALYVYNPAATERLRRGLDPLNVLALFGLSFEHPPPVSTGGCGVRHARAAHQHAPPPPPPQPPRQSRLALWIEKTLNNAPPQPEAKRACRRDASPVAQPPLALSALTPQQRRAKAQKAEEQYLARLRPAPADKK
eukprot:TRINITY_DN2904_c1_g2_i2.p1 TRINITY_DN2904_c1_g2~~TRINITY_DN2904_c1_g2_i2.p1  ORF type:complete len:363 (+),score=57.62 TRINITY_DN2904_c1_g2_i2:719-1807(+)